MTIGPYKLRDVSEFRALYDSLARQIREYEDKAANPGRVDVDGFRDDPEAVRDKLYDLRTEFEVVRWGLSIPSAGAIDSVEMDLLMGKPDTGSVD